MREFQSGATRDSNDHKLQIHRFLSPEVQLRYCEYLQKHRIQADGKLRDPDNWKKGMDQAVYFESLTRHFFEAWAEFERTGTVDLDVMCAIRFNVDGFMFEGLREENKAVEIDKLLAEQRELSKQALQTFNVVFSPEYQAAQAEKNRRAAEFIKGIVSPSPDISWARGAFQPPTSTGSCRGPLEVDYPPLCPCGAKENEQHKPWCGGSAPE